MIDRISVHHEMFTYYRGLVGKIIVIGMAAPVVFFATIMDEPAQLTTINENQPEFVSIVVLIWAAYYFILHVIHSRMEKHTLKFISGLELPNKVDDEERLFLNPTSKISMHVPVLLSAVFLISLRCGFGTN